VSEVPRATDPDDGAGDGPESHDAAEWTAGGGWWVPELDELYDAETLGAIESWARGRVSGQPSVPGDAPTDVAVEPAGRRDVRSMGTGAAMLAAGLFGLADALEPEKVRPATIEHVPDVAADDQAVTYLHVPGDPRASQIILRPWLL
jgi:hypothetical protein